MLDVCISGGVVYLWMFIYLWAFVYLWAIDCSCVVGACIRVSVVCLIWGHVFASVRACNSIDDIYICM